jgi:hypothetical protein
MVSETVNLGRVTLKFEDLTENEKESLKGAGFDYKVEGNNFFFKREDEDTYSLISLNGLDYKWDGTSLGVKNSDENNYSFVNLKGEDGWIPCFRLDSEGNLYVNDGNSLKSENIYTKTEVQEIVDELKERIKSLEEKIG